MTQPTAWSSNSVKAAAALEKPLSAIKALPLEKKITLAAALLGTFARLGADTGPPSSVLAEALRRTDEVECLDPFLGDEEWKDLAPPDTDYLLEKEEIVRVVSWSFMTTREVLITAPRATGLDLAHALLFRIDSGFRNGIRSMISKAVDYPPFDYFYVPALVVGNPPRHS